MADYFRCYRSYIDAIRSLPKAKRLSFFDAMADYALDGKEPELTGIEQTLFIAFKPNIDASNARAAASAYNGYQGGRPKNNLAETYRKPSNNLEKPNENLGKPTETYNINIPTLNSISKGSSLLVDRLPVKEISQKFRKPTIEEINSYCKEKGYKVDSDSFLAYYESVGWKVGNKPMKDWQAAIRTWHYRDNPKGGDTVDFGFRNAKDVLAAAENS